MCMFSEPKQISLHNNMSSFLYMDLVILCYNRRTEYKREEYSLQNEIIVWSNEDVKH